MASRIRLDQLESVARNAGYEDFKSLLHDYYVVQRVGLTTLAERLHIAVPRLKRHLKRFGIEVHGRGGANNTKIVVTPELVREVTRDGIPAVARRLGISITALLRQLNTHS